MACCHIRQNHGRKGQTSHRSLAARIFRNSLALCPGGLYSLSVVILMRGLIGHEAVNGYEEGDAYYAETI